LKLGQAVGDRRARYVLLGEDPGVALLDDDRRARQPDRSPSAKRKRPFLKLEMRSSSDLRSTAQTIAPSWLIA
jgi:hypothetical protein